MVAEPAAELTVGALLGMLTGAFHGSGGGAVAGDDMVALIAWAAAACQVVLASVLWLAAPRVRARDSLRLAALSCAVAAVGTLLRAWEPSARYSMASALSVVAYVGHAALTLATLRTVSGNKSPLAGLTPWLLLGGAASLAGLVLPAIASLGHGLAYVIAALMYGAGSVLIFRGHRAWTSSLFSSFAFATAIGAAIFAALGLASIVAPAWLALWLTPLIMGAALLIGMIASVLGSCAYLVVVLMELIQRIEGQAAHDPLTGALNRRGLEQQIDRVRRTGGRPKSGHQTAESAGYGVIAVDIDHFKRVNDSHGHPAGDAVLREVVERLRGELRRSDVLARVGGEEFIAVLPGSGADATDAAAERMRRAVESAPIQLPDGTGIAVTASLGTTATANPLQCLRLEMAHADEALYAAKQAGRNRVVRHCRPVTSADHTGAKDDHPGSGS